MRWSMSLSLGTSICRAVRVGVMAVPLALGVMRAPAQDVVEVRYQQAVDFFNNAKMEDACELLQQVEKEKPGYKQTKTYLNAACNQVKRMIKMEEDLFNEGVQYANQGRYDDAKQKFEQANKIPLKSPKFRSQANRYLKDIETRQNEERLLQEGVKLFTEGKYSQAQSRLKQVVQGGGSKASDAQKLLAQIDEAERKQRSVDESTTLFNEGVRLFNAGKRADAHLAFEKVVRGGGAKVAEARGYLQRLEQLSQAQAQPSKPPTGADQASPAGVSEEVLRTGLQEYFEGKFDDAERDLSEYLNGNGPKRALAIFFRGAAHSTRFYLSGERDRQQKDLALADFRALKEHAPQFEPPKRYVSPQILAIYYEAVSVR